MKFRRLTYLLPILVVVLVLASIYVVLAPPGKRAVETEIGAEIKLPEPDLEGEMSLEEALLTRRSIRDFLDREVPLDNLSQILWAAQGITAEWGGRTAPSAGGTYPLELYVQVKGVEGLDKGVYHYSPENHSLRLIKLGDYSEELMTAALNQECVGGGSLNLVLTADFSRTMNKYGERGRRYVYLEAGHCAQNVYLQVTSLQLGNVVVGAFYDEEVQRVLSIPENHEPIYVIPIGFPK